MLLREAFLAVMGLCAGGVIAAGIFAFLVIIGVYPRLIGMTKTAEHIFLYETIIVLGGIAGNVVDLYEIPMEFPVLAQTFMIVMGLSVGIFVGCLFMSLAETLKALPTVTRRLRLAVGLPWLILALALGKLTGSLIYFIKGFG